MVMSTSDDIILYIHHDVLVLSCHLNTPEIK